MLRGNEKLGKYFELLSQRKLADAEKVLEEIKQSLNNSEKHRGYRKGLEGLLLTQRSSDDRYLYFNRTKMTSKLANELRKEFNLLATGELHAEYDKGYFNALADYARVLARTRPWVAQEIKGAPEEAVPSEKKEVSTASK